MSASNVSSSSYVIEINNLDKEFNETGTKTLSGIHLRLSPGEFVFLTGASGSGKTTLLKMIMGLLPSTRGEIFVSGKAVHKISDSQKRRLRRGVGIILQEHHLLQTLNVAENIELPLIWAGLSSSARRKRVAEILEIMDLSSLAFSLPKSLSGGEKQRASIARALITAPQLILADEPTGNLDPPTSRQLVRMLRDLRAKGSTVLFATHDMSLVRDFGGRVLELISGKLPPDSHPATDQRFKVPEFWGRT